jgi:hypothetical protein
MAVFYSPVFNENQFKSDGTLAVGYKIYTYAEGSTTPLATYTTSSGSVAQENPIVLNARGQTTNPIWLTGGLGYKLVLTTDADVVVRTEDNIRGVGDTTTTADQWIASGLTPTYVSATSFTLSGDQTSAFQVGRRVKSTVTAGTAYSVISASVFTTLTTVTVVNDSGSALDSGLTSVSYGLLTTDNPSIPILKDSDFKVSGSVDRTKKVGFEVDGLTTSTTRTLTIPDKDGTIATTSDTANQNGLITNVGLAVTMASNAVTIALKGTNGNDPSSSNPVIIGFRNSTLTNGQSSIVSVTSALSTVISSGSTGGTSSGQPSRIWIAAINNSGTGELAWFNSLSSGSIGSINEGGLISTTAEGGAGAADSAQVWYSTTARSNVPITVLGYFDSTQTTAGTWAASATNITPNPKKRPSDTIQLVSSTSGTVATGTGTIPIDNTIPQNTEGDQYMTVTITPTNASSTLEIELNGYFANTASAANGLMVALFQDSTAGALAAVMTNHPNSTIASHTIKHIMTAGTTSAITFKIRAGGNAGTTTFNGFAGAQYMGGIMASRITIKEYVA